MGCGSSHPEKSNKDKKDKDRKKDEKENNNKKRTMERKISRPGAESNPTPQVEEKAPEPPAKSDPPPVKDNEDKQVKLWYEVMGQQELEEIAVPAKPAKASLAPAAPAAPTEDPPTEPAEIAPETAPETKAEPEIAEPEVLEALRGPPSVMGRECQVTLDVRAQPYEQDDAKPEVAEGELWTDPDFPYDVAMEGKPGLAWKRPGDFAEAPKLFTEGTTRFDVGQGSAGTCYFLSVLSALADKEELIKQVIVEDYSIGTAEYRGVFHCRFWRLGEWHDVYVDDCLPYRDDIQRVWGSYSSSDPNEMWISLMEKALAKFFGSYQKVEGGNPGDAFTALTGGLADRVDHDKPTCDVFLRVRNALMSGCIAATSVGADMDGQQGLVGGHAYSVTGASKVTMNGRAVPLLRVRNPWGVQKGEWKGAWSDGAPEWNAVPETVKDKLKVSGKGDGEFWISRVDYMKYFRNTTICSFRPDFDEDGTQDDLDKTCIALGDWYGETAAGSKFPQKFKNPRFTINIGPSLVGSAGSIPVVLQLSQRKLKKSREDLVPIRLDLYKIEGTFKKPKLSVVLDELTNMTTYMVNETVVYRYACTAGRYILIPHTMKEDMLKDFMIRVFSTKALSIKQYEETPALFMRRFEVAEHFSLTNPQDMRLEHHFGQWSGKNSGGQIGNETFERNPQYALQVEGSEEVEAVIGLKQNSLNDRDPIGLCVYQVQAPQKMPLPIRYLWNHYNDLQIKPSQGDTFIVAYEASAVFSLPPGLYSVIAFTDQPEVQKDYVMSFGFRAKAKVSVRGYNVMNSSISIVK